MIQLLKKYFDLQELVCPHVYNNTRLRAMAWDFFDPRLLETLLFIREKIGLPIFVNNWYVGGSLSQRGLRCNVCALVAEKTRLEKPYITPHLQGIAIDFDVDGMTAQTVRDWLEQNKALLPYPIRVESNVSWVHIDLRNHTSQKISYFSE